MAEVLVRRGKVFMVFLYFILLWRAMWFQSGGFGNMAIINSSHTHLSFLNQSLQFSNPSGFSGYRSKVLSSASLSFLSP